tara:strand:+ start:3534 stop:4703 length:1170 start_codon:yes stop_codon:yes gene_type:complete
VRRVFVLVLDSLGVGATPDAASFGDEAAHTLDHLVEAAGGLDAPRLRAIGLGNIEGVHSLGAVDAPEGAFGRMAEVSPGKDTPTGHWEMMGCPLDTAFPLFPDGFPADILAEIAERAGIDGWLGNYPASGTVILDALGPEHMASGKPIAYTSGDSVFQIAAHTGTFGLERLYDVCRVAREVLDRLNVGRIIARPFIGEPGAFQRTYDRKDWSIPPPTDTSLDRLMAAGVPTIGVGKISDIFAGRGVSRSVHSEGNDDGMAHTLELADELDGGLVFLNLVDFDSLYGHRRDPKGYRAALETFDGQLAQLEAKLRPDDLVLMTADHGNDPTFYDSSDHTREYVPALVIGPGVKPGVDLGTRSSFADLGATVEEAFGLSPVVGTSFLSAFQQ